MSQLDQSPIEPLSRDKIRALLVPTEARTRRYARVLATWALITGAAMAALVSGLMLHSDSSMVSESIVMGVLSFFFFGVLVALAARYLVLRDLQYLPSLVDRGQTLRGELVSHRVVANGVHQVVVLWKEAGEEVGAHFDVDQLRDPGSDRYLTIVSSGQRQVGVVLNDQLCLALRNNPRFQRWKAQSSK